jgi:hypothetical protein
LTHNPSQGLRVNLFSDFLCSFARRTDLQENKHLVDSMSDYSPLSYWNQGFSRSTRWFTR